MTPPNGESDATDPRGAAPATRPPAAAPAPTKRERRMAGAVLALIVLHALLGYFLPGVPAWKMFAIAERYDYRLTDAHGSAVDLRDYVSRDLYLVNHELVVLIGMWIAEEHPERAPFRAVVDLHTADGTVRKVWAGREYRWEPQAR